MGMRSAAGRSGERGDEGTRHGRSGEGVECDRGGMIPAVARKMGDEACVEGERGEKRLVLGEENRDASRGVTRGGEGRKDVDRDGGKSSSFAFMPSVPSGVGCCVVSHTRDEGPSEPISALIAANSELDRVIFQVWGIVRGHGIWHGGSRAGHGGQWDPELQFGASPGGEA